MGKIKHKFNLHNWVLVVADTNGVAIEDENQELGRIDRVDDYLNRPGYQVAIYGYKNSKSLQYSITKFCYEFQLKSDKSGEK